jgi:hypothetical protein
MTRRKINILAAAALPALFLALIPLVRRIEPLSRAVQPGAEVLNINSPRLLKKLSLGYDALLADIYWTRVVQYYGGHRRDRIETFRLLKPLIDAAVALDPHLLVAYKVGSMFLSEPAPRGAGQPEQAAALLRRGIVNNPDEWRLWADLGFLYYEFLRDHRRAAAAYLQGSKHPQAREFMKVMAARIAQQGRTRDISRALWTELFTSSSDPNIRKNAREHLLGLRAEEEAEALERLAAQFRQQTGRWPASTAEMAQAGLLGGIPVDPEGFPYLMGPEGKVRLDPRSPVLSPLLEKRD